MANEQKIFLKQLAIDWQHEFPFLKPVDLDEVPRVPKGCNFRCDAYGKSRKRYYFVKFLFSQKRRGEFSIALSVSDSAERSVLDQTKVEEPTPYAVGMFTVWKFLDRQRFDWALIDLEAEQRALFAKLGVPKIDLGSVNGTNVWRPSTYDQPFDQIVKEAIADVNKKLRLHVFPVLQL